MFLSSVLSVIILITYSLNGRQFIRIPTLWSENFVSQTIDQNLMTVSIEPNLSVYKSSLVFASFKWPYLTPIGPSGRFMCFCAQPSIQVVRPVIPGTQPPTQPITGPPATEPPATETPATEPPATEPPASEPPSTEPPATEPSATEPPVTEPLATEPSASESPATEPPATEPPTTEPPATEPPATEPPTTEPPATEPPTTEPPATEPPATQAPENEAQAPTEPTEAPAAAPIFKTTTKTIERYITTIKTIVTKKYNNIAKGIDKIYTNNNRNNLTNISNLISKKYSTNNNMNQNKSLKNASNIENKSGYTCNISKVSSKMSEGFKKNTNISLNNENKKSIELNSRIIQRRQRIEYMSQKYKRIKRRKTRKRKQSS